MTKPFVFIGLAWLALGTAACGDSGTDGGGGSGAGNGGSPVGASGGGGNTSTGGTGGGDVSVGGGVPADECLDPTNCLLDADCAGGSRCNDELTPPQCQKLFCGKEGTICDEVELCEAGLKCFHNVCVPEDYCVPETGYCEGTAECCQGSCVANACVPEDYCAPIGGACSKSEHCCATLQLSCSASECLCASCSAVINELAPNGTLDLGWRDLICPNVQFRFDNLVDCFCGACPTECALACTPGSGEGNITEACFTCLANQDSCMDEYFACQTNQP